MQQHQIHSFLERYFVANECKISAKTDTSLTVQLSVELDKLLMNRPFYWHYLEKTGGNPQPLQVSFTTNTTEKDKGEVIHFGSPRLHQLFATTRSLGGFIRLYEQAIATSNNSHSLHPWLGINIKVSFQSNDKKDVLLSLGLNLIHGQIVTQFHEKLCELSLTKKIPDYCFTLSPLIKVKSGLARIEKMVHTYIENEDDTWARNSMKRMENDLNLLEAFYEDYDEKPESYHTERTALIELYEPKVFISIINGGIFYLKQQVF